MVVNQDSIENEVIGKDPCLQFWCVILMSHYSLRDEEVPFIDEFYLFFGLLTPQKKLNFLFGHRDELLSPFPCKKFDRIKRCMAWKMTSSLRHLVWRVFGSESNHPFQVMFLGGVWIAFASNSGSFPEFGLDFKIGAHFFVGGVLRPAPFGAHFCLAGALSMAVVISSFFSVSCLASVESSVS